MRANLFSDYADFLRTSSSVDLAREIDAPQRLRLDVDRVGAKALEVAYAPFDHVNTQARIVIVGITPGRQQMCAALTEAQRQLKAGTAEAEALSRAKVHASFAGPMRANLVAMLDEVGIAAHLGLETAAALWGRDSDMVHFTSALRYPVFVDGANYSGAPDMLATPMLRRHLMSWFAVEAAQLPEALYVPLGDKVADAVEAAMEAAGVKRARILRGLPHPSGANAERIAYFLGRKARAALSAKVNPDRLDVARATLQAQVAGFRGRA